MLQHNKKNEKTPNTFVDGVPVKISEQYKPPRKITLPFSCQNCSPSDMLYAEYDFRLENTVMSKLTEWKKMRQLEGERRKERLKAAEEVCQDLENFRNITLGDLHDEGAEPARQMYNPKLGDSILTPVSAKVNSPSNEPASKLFNLSDFESDNSSPFDNMELKTINDMEVLASILTPDNAKQSFNNNYNIIDKELNRNGLALNKSNEWDQASLNALTSYNGSVRPPSYIDRYGTLNSISENFQCYNYELNKFSNQCGAGVSSVPGSSVRQPESHFLGNMISDKSYQVDLNSAKTSPKSVPDIVNELEKELVENRERDLAAERRMKTPPPIESASQKPESSAYVKKTSRKLSDPTSSLNAELSNLTHHISEMGFPLARVARACKLFDGDDKKVVEFLLQVQSLEEKNYPGDLAERALPVNDFKLDKTANYLNSMLVLLDLGFDEEKIEDALKKTNSDRDKALDMLIS